ncbi:NAD(P)/FAD-dependent oxidoreductase [Streptomyces sp. 8N616]|uniref:NAD(P)/FAD-dependent oxidoreductase n=1 Tax=Streptomyces sp. 8N616 TaxID=3457414 RepID=UPI003FD30697
MAHILVSGAGIAGLSTALFLSRRGHRVTVLEQDSQGASGDLEKDFLDWHRPHIPQAIQPHGLLSPVRKVLNAEAGDVYRSMLDLGAWEQHEFDWFTEHPPYRDGDEELVLIRTRRIVMEHALAQAVRCERGIALRTGERVQDVIIDHGARVPHVLGVRTAMGAYHADLVIDAGGRRSRLAGRLVAAGCRAPVVERHRVGLSYFCRWYRMKTAGATDPGRVPYTASSPYALSIAFPSDNATLAVAIAASVSDPTLPALRDPLVFDELARCFPSTGPWLALDPDPLTDVVIMAGLDNRWTALVDSLGPVATGIVAVGDAAVVTNPTLTQGIALGLLTAQRIAQTAHQAGDRVAFAQGHHEWAVRTLKPWFDQQVEADRAGAERLALAPDAPSSSAALAAARFPCGLEDPVVMRAWAQARHLLRTPAEVFGTPEVQARVEHWLRRHPDFAPYSNGPSREEWEKVTGHRAGD